MGTIKYGTTEFSDIKVGDSQVSKVYIGNSLVWQNHLNPITEVLHPTDIQAITHTANNVLLGGTNGTLYYYDTNLANLSNFPTNYGGRIIRIRCNSTDAFVFGTTTNKVYKYNLSSKNKTAETTYTYSAYYSEAGMAIDTNNNVYISYKASDGYSYIKKFGSSLGSELDSGRVINTDFFNMLYSNAYLYLIDRGEYNSFKVYKVHVSNLSTVVLSTSSINLGGATVITSYGLSTDGTYLYVAGGNKLYKLLQSDLSIVSSIDTSDFLEDLVVIGDYIYTIGGSISKYDKSLNLIKSRNVRDAKFLSANPLTYIGENIFAAGFYNNYINKYGL